MIPMWIKYPLLSLLYRLQGMPTLTAKTLSAEILARHVTSVNEVQCIIEAGANNGEHSLWLATQFPKATIHCFEPEPRAIERFRSNVGNHPRITLHPFALAATDTTLQFYQSSGTHPSGEIPAMPQGWDLSGSLKKPKLHLDVHPWVAFNSVIEVTARSLDSWCAEHRIPSVDLLWMDVQGAERDVIQGALKTINSTNLIYTEYSNRELYEGQPSFAELMALLPDFTVAERLPSDVLFKRKESI